MTKTEEAPTTQAVRSESQHGDKHSAASPDGGYGWVIIVASFVSGTRRLILHGLAFFFPHGSSSV